MWANEDRDDGLDAARGLFVALAITAAAGLMAALVLAVGAM